METRELCRRREERGETLALEHVQMAPFPHLLTHTHEQYSTVHTLLTHTYSQAHTLRMAL